MSRYKGSDSPGPVGGQALIDLHDMAPLGDGVGTDVIEIIDCLAIVPLKEMAQTSRDRDFIRTTLYIISPALNGGRQRSRLYSPDHDHLFRQKH